jgi:hypothetical protein
MLRSYHVNVGYEFLMRSSAAAIVSLGLCVSAVAGTIEGTLWFPGEVAPSMTAYAFDLDTARIRSVQLASGQAGFRLDVPAGRYQVFLAPNEPGAPNIYGAHTGDDHNLVTVTISAKTPRAAVKIDDWYLSDDIDEQIDHMRGIATNANTEPLGAPRFSEYPSTRIDTPAPAGGPNFAGQMTVAVTRCGSSCLHASLIDWRSGTQHDPVPLAEIQGTLPCRADEALLFRRDSRLLIVTRARGAGILTQYYLWNPAEANFTLLAEYEVAAAAFCMR